MVWGDTAMPVRVRSDWALTQLHCLHKDRRWVACAHPGTSYFWRRCQSSHVGTVKLREDLSSTIVLTFTLFFIVNVQVFKWHLLSSTRHSEHIKPRPLVFGPTFHRAFNQVEGFALKFPSSPVLLPIYLLCLQDELNSGQSHSSRHNKPLSSPLHPNPQINQWWNIPTLTGTEPTRVIIQNDYIFRKIFSPKF